MRLGRIATLAMLAIAAVAPAMAQTITRSGEPFNPPVVSVRRYVTRMVDSLGGHKAGMRDSAVWETPARSLPVPMPVGGMSAADTSARVLATDNSGNLYATDPYVPAWGSSSYYNAINDTITTGASPFQAESTLAFPFTVAGYKRCAIWLEVKPASADTGNIYLAVQARAGISSAQDSTSMAYISQWRPLGGTATMDTALVYGTNTVPWEGEVPIEFSAGRSFGGGDPRSSALSPYGAFPRMRFLPLRDAGGAPIECPYISFRVRGMYTGPAKTLTSKPRIILHVVFWS